MEIEKLHVIRRQGEVMGFDSTPLQSPSVPGQMVFNLDQPERSPQLKALFDITAG